MEKAIFIADAHLKSPDTPEYHDFISFLDEIVLGDSSVDTLFVLGDLFDFFVGFPKVVFYEHMEILLKLKEAAKKGAAIYYFEGNHDFFLKKFSRLGFPVNIVERELDLLLGGKFYVSHGDLVNHNDYSHRFMSAVVRNPATHLLAYLLPPHLVYDFAHFFSRFSRENISCRKKFTENIFDQFAADCVAGGYAGAILGHFHKSMVIEKQVQGSRFSIHLLGSWKYDRAYMTWEHGVLTTHNFSQKNTLPEQGIS